MVVLLLLIELISSVTSRFYLIENLFWLRLLWILLLIYYLQFKSIRKNGIIAILSLIIIAFFLTVFGDAHVQNYKTFINTIFVTFCLYSSFNYSRGNKILKYYLYYFVFNGFLALTGLIFDIPFFKSEMNSQRFGYTGLLPKANNELLYLLLIIAYIKAPLKLSLFKDSLLILSGLKSAFIAFLILKRKYYYLLLPILVLVIFYNLYDIILNASYLDYFMYFYNERGFISMITSGRLDRLALFDLSFFPALKFINFESDPVTLIYNFGIFFSIPIFLIYIKLFKIFIKIKQYDLLFLFLGGVFLMGHLIDSTFALTFTVLYLQGRLKNNESILN